MLNKTFNKKEKAFTVTELLVITAVIAIVSSFTISALISRTNDKDSVLINKANDIELKTKFKSVYSNLNRVTMQIKQDNDNSLAGVFDSSDGFRDEYLKYMQAVKTCDSGTAPGTCFPAAYKLADGSDNAINEAFSRVQLINGGSLAFFLNSAGCTNSSCGTLLIDVNGLKDPNIAGKDIFRVRIAQNGLYTDGANGINEQEK